MKRRAVPGGPTPIVGRPCRPFDMSDGSWARAANRTITNRPNPLGTALAYQLRIGRTVSVVRGRSSMMQQVAVFSMAVDPRVSEELKHHWRRFVVLGAALIVLGVVALGSVGIATITSVLVFGWILVVAGILKTIHAWHVRGWSGFTRHLLGGVLSFVFGGLIVANPAAG